MTTGRRLWIFRILAILILPVALLLLEAGLRIIDYGFPTELALKETIKGRETYTNNDKYAWRFFPPTIARTAYPFSFPVDKDDNAYRIFVLGGSAAAGTPDGAFSFGRILETMLTEKYDQIKFEVITLAMPAINSHVVLEIAKECADYQPDLFLVYLGNNEVVGPYGAGTVFTPISGNLALIRFGIAFKRTKIAQLYTNLIAYFRDDNNPQTWRGMSMFLENQVRASNPNLAEVYENFRENLEDIQNSAKDGGAKIIFSTVASNLKDSPPFASLHKKQLTDSQKAEWDKIYKQGINYEENSDYSKALDFYLKASLIDTEYADLHFRMGKCYERLGAYKKSIEHYSLARRFDTLRFRADNSINEIIRDLANQKKEQGVFLIDAEKEFSENSPNGMPGDSLFYEHVHMNFSGNYLLAKTFYEKIEEILPEWVREEKLSDTPLPRKDVCAEMLAYFDHEKQRFANLYLLKFQKEAPFTNQLYSRERIKQLRQQLMALSDNVKPAALKSLDPQYRSAIESNPLDWWLHWKYGEYLEQLGQNKAAIKKLQSVLEMVPNNYLAYGRIAGLHFKERDVNKAIEYYSKAIESYPIYTEAYLNLGIFHHGLKQYDKAVYYYKETIRLGLYLAETYNKLAVVLHEQGESKAAIEAFNEGITRVPNNFKLNYNFGVMLLQQKQHDAAMTAFRRALAIDPNSEKTKKILKSLELNLSR